MRLRKAYGAIRRPPDEVDERSGILGGEPLKRMPRHYAIFVVSRIRPENVKAGGSRELPSV